MPSEEDKDVVSLVESASLTLASCLAHTKQVVKTTELNELMQD